jgi:hypothetical protein
MNFSRRGSWESPKEFMSMNVHMERLFWRFGIFPWRNEHGDVRVEIPLTTDAEALQQLTP